MRIFERHTCLLEGHGMGGVRVYPLHRPPHYSATRQKIMVTVVFALCILKKHAFVCLFIFTTVGPPHEMNSGHKKCPLFAKLRKLMTKVPTHSSTRQSRQAPKADHGTSGIKMRSSPDRTRCLRAGRVLLCEPSHSYETDARATGAKRKVEEDAKTPARKKRKGELPEDKESSCNSGDNACLQSTQVAPQVGGFLTADGEEASVHPEMMKPSDDDVSGVCWAQLELKYVQERLLAVGGCGSVFTGYRKTDNFPVSITHVAIKHIPKDNNITLQHKDRINMSSEVAVMKKLAKDLPEGRSPYVTLLDWYDLGQKLILVMERPVPAEDLTEYISKKGGCLDESEAKVILKQLLDVAQKLEEKHIFHRDIKTENILIESTPDGLHVRIIDFGLSCFTKKRSLYRLFFGTPSLEPPEWLRHQWYRAGPTTAWQIGTVLFDILHSEVEFQTEAYLKEEIKISNRFSDDCRDFLQKSLTAAPEERPTLKELRRHKWLK
ncbi:serine/threonine-protein kinase pim-2-like isoform X2 [Hippocampus zosterae]|uniref:serine/threonine-protein kinase pim-2-like isoform X2 n=1 Tax=Hippocampus zosterae TaxID=109293 RepID=UPI00223DDD29|nr:serine/threonine-protein kinase pim-2-like isoform X2 [Hippocampus zosterae]